MDRLRRLRDGLCWAVRLDAAERDVVALTGIGRRNAREVVRRALRQAVAHGHPISETLDELTNGLAGGLTPRAALQKALSKEEFIRSLLDTAAVRREEAEDLLRELRQAYPPQVPGPTAVECARLLREKPPAEEE